MILDLKRCPCGAYPWDAPLGEFCKGSDPADPGMHQFLEEVRTSLPPSPVRASSGDSTLDEGARA